MIGKKRTLFTLSLVLLCLCVLSFPAFGADPKYTKSSTFGPKITDGVTEEFLAMIREDPDIAKGKPLRLGGRGHGGGSEGSCSSCGYPHGA